MSELNSIRTAAKALRISVSTAYRLCQTGRLPSVKSPASGAWSVIPPTTEHVLTTAALADAMGYTDSYIRKLIAKKTISSVFIGSRHRIPLTEAAKLMLLRLKQHVTLYHI